MKVSVVVPNPSAGEGFDRPDTVRRVAQAVEAAGLHACGSPDHPFPLVRDGRAGHHTWDPFVVLTWVAAATSSVLLHTNVIVLPYRNPFLTAKSAGTLDVLSGGRLVLGVGSGYLEEEFAALGVEFAGRARLVDDAVVAIVAAWQGQPVHSETPEWRASGNVMLPRPVTRPHPPLWIGGNSRPAMRRALEFGDVWAPFEVAGDRSRQTHTRSLEGVAGLGAALAEFRRLREETETERSPGICFTRPRPDWLLDSTERARDELGRIEELGVDWVSVNLHPANPDEMLGRIAALGELVSG